MDYRRTQGTFREGKMSCLDHYIYWLSMILPPGLTLRGHSTHSLAEQKNEWPDIASEGLKMTRGNSTL